jgi:hypothetical protein
MKRTLYLYYLDRFAPVECAARPVECALSEAVTRGCKPERVCRWFRGSRFVVEVFCEEGPSVKLMDSPDTLFDYYREEGRAVCQRPPPPDRP